MQSHGALALKPTPKPRRVCGIFTFYLRKDYTVEKSACQDICLAAIQAHRSSLFSVQQPLHHALPIIHWHNYRYFHANLHSAAFQLAAQIVMKVSTFSTFCPILKARSYTTKHGRRSRKNSLVLDSMLISVSSTFQAQISGSLRPYTKNCFNSC